MLNNKYFKFTIWFLLVVLIAFVFKELTFMTNFIRIILIVIVLPTIIASLFYYLLRPLVRYLEKKKINKTVSVLSVMFLMIVMIALLITLAGTAIVDEFGSFYETMVEYFQNVPDNTEEILDDYDFLPFSYSDLEGYLLSSFQTVFEIFRENILGWVKNITEFGTILILIPMVIFFLLKDDKLIHKNMIQMVPTKFKEKAKTITSEMDRVLQDYFIGQLLVAGILGILTYIGYLIIGLPNALFLATFSMIFSIIPFLGPLIGVLPAILIAFTSNFMMVVQVIVVMTITQQLEGNIIRPKIMENRLKIHPMVVIFLVILAVTLFGFLGAFFVIPFYAIMRILIKHTIDYSQDN